jgi:hypothetical protein
MSKLDGMMKIEGASFKSMKADVVRCENCDVKPGGNKFSKS